MSLSFMGSLPALGADVLVGRRVCPLRLAAGEVLRRTADAVDAAGTWAGLP
jgi:hypothetical protein